MKKAIYAGSFDPITYGHIDIIKRAASLFDELVIAIMQNPDKVGLFSEEERKTLILESCSEIEGVSVEIFDGLLVDFAKSQEIYTVIRGLRAVSDFEYECQMALTNRQLCPDLESVFLMTASEYSFLSSSLAKELARYDADMSSFVPNCVALALKEKYE